MADEIAEIIGSGWVNEQLFVSSREREFIESGETRNLERQISGNKCHD